MQPLTLSIKELQQHSSTTTNQAEHFTLLNKQLQQSSITTSQPPPLILNQLKQLPSTVISHVQSPVLMDKQYFPPFIGNSTESNVLNMNKQQSYETVLPHNDNNDAGQVQVTLPKIKRRKTNADTPRGNEFFFYFLFIEFYKCEKLNLTFDLQLRGSILPFYVSFITIKQICML